GPTGQQALRARRPGGSRAVHGIPGPGRGGGAGRRTANERDPEWMAGSIGQRQRHSVLIMNIAIIQEMLKEKHKLPDDFFWDRVGAVGGDSPDTELTGKRCPLIKSGPNKDRPNWYAGPAESWRTFIVTPEDVE